MAARIYLYETREQRLTDHAAVDLHLDVEAVSRLSTEDLLDNQMTLF